MEHSISIEEPSVSVEVLQFTSLEKPFR